MYKNKILKTKCLTGCSSLSDEYNASSFNFNQALLVGLNRLVAAQTECNHYKTYLLSQ